MNKLNCMTNLLSSQTRVVIYLITYLFSVSNQAQLAPTEIELQNYQGIFLNVVKQEFGELNNHIKNSTDLETRDSHGRTVLLVAVHLSDESSARLLLENGAHSNAMDNQAYDLITIAAVNNDVEMIALGLEFGADPSAITSPYDGTALIAAAHLGHVETVKILIAAGAPLDHVNNLGWTALIESIVLGDGGESHTEILKLLVAGGANIELADRQGRTPIQLARQQGFSEMVSILEKHE